MRSFIKSKKIAGVFLALGISTAAFAQPLSGTYTVGGTTPSYATLSDAVNALNTNGVSGPVVLNVRDGNYTATAWRAEIKSIPGASATNRVTIKSETNNAANVVISVIPTTSATNYVVKFNSASFVTLKDITLKNTGAATGTVYSRVLDFAGTSGNDSVINCRLESNARTTESTNTALLYASSLTGANNVFIGNTFLNNSYGAYFYGTSATNKVPNAAFLNNTFTNQYGHAFEVYYADDFRFNNNVITTNSASTTYYGLETRYCDGALQIIGNKISGFTNGYGMYLYYNDGTATTPGIVANNVISNTGGTGTVRGIQNYYSSYQRIYNNTVRIAGTSATAAIPAYFYYSSASYSNNEIRNNVFANFGGGYAMYVYNPAAYDNTWDYNNLFTTGTKLVDRGTPSTDYAKLTDWRAGGGQDLNSISYNPGFTSATNLAPNPAKDSTWSLNGRGVHLAGNDKDVNGNARATTLAAGVPDIGAYEFTPTVAPPAAVATPATPIAGNTQVFTFGEDTVATIGWNASSAVPSTITVRQYTGTIAAGIPAISSTSMFFYTDIVASAGTYNYTSNIYYKEPWLGTIAAETGLRLVKKDGSNPWVPFSPAVSNADVNRNIITTPNLTSFGWNTGIDVANNASVTEITEPTGLICSGSLPVKAKIRNAGSNTLNSVQINWQVDGVTQTPINYNTAIPLNSETIVTLGNVVFANGVRTIKVWTSLPNNGVDPVSQDDTVSVSLRDGLSGVFTVGGASPNYQNIGSAIAALNQYGVCGPVTFNIRNGLYTEQAQLNTIPGSSSVNRVTFTSESGNAANVTMSFDATGTTDNYVFRIGASNVSVKDITVEPKDSTYMRGIELTGAASNDSIVNCHLLGIGTTKESSNAALMFVDNLTGKNNVIKGNTFSWGCYGLHYSGTGTTNLTDSGVIIGNTFQNQYQYASYLYYTNNLKFNNNTIVTNSTNTDFSGVYTYYGDGALQIMNNKISGARGGNGIRQYYSDANASAKAQIANNVISVGDGTNTIHGLHSQYSSNQRIYNNSVNVTGTNATTAIAGYFYYSSATYEGNEIRNNVFANTGGGYAMYVYNPTYANTFDYNNLYTKGAKLVDRGTPAADYANLTAWRAAHGQDMNSLSFNPGFTSVTDLKPNAAIDSSWSLNGRGIHIVGNDKDIDGNARAVVTSTGVPDIGAYEFTPTVIPPVAVATPAVPTANTTQVFTFGEDTVATIEWDAAAAVPSAIEVRQYTGTLPVGINAVSPRSMYFYTDIAAPTGTYAYNSSIYYKDPWMGTIAASESAIRLAKKESTNPWTIFNPQISASNTTRNFIYTTGLTDFGHNTGLDIANNAGISEMTSPPGRLCSGTFPVKAIVKNNGSNVLNSVKVYWTVNGVNQPTLTYTTPISVSGQAEVNLGNIVFTNGQRDIKIWTAEPNGAVDSVSADDTLSVTLRDGLSGLYTIGGTTPDYPTVNAAIADLNKYGMCGAVTLSIRPGSYNEQVQIDTIFGLNAANRLTIKSEADDATTVNINFTATAAANNYVLRLNDVSYVTIKDISLTANGTTQARALQFIGGASFDSVLNCRLVGPVLTTASTNTSLLYGDDLTGQKIVFKGNTFQNGSYGAYFRGTSSSSLTDGVVFDGNTFDNQFTYAAYPYYIKDLKFNNNTVTTSSMDNLFYGIYIGYADGALEVTRNKVIGPQGGYGIYLNYCDATATVRGNVSNNIISMGAGTNTVYGLRVSYSSYQNVYNNSVNVLAGSATASYAGYIYSNSATTTDNEFKNNVFANQGPGYALYVYDPSYNTSDFNNLYTAGVNMVDRGTPAADFTTLQAWRTASGQEMNSIAHDPGYMSGTDLHPDPSNPASWSLNGRGVHITSNNLDMDKNARITNLADGAPDLGAYEFVPTSTPPAAIATPASPAPGTTQVFTFGQDTVAVLTWKPNSVMPNFIEVRQYSGEKAPQYTQAGFMYFHTDVNTQTVTHNFDAAIYYKDTWRGTTGTESNLKIVKKLGSNPWVAFNGTGSSANTNRNILNATAMSSFGVFTGGNDNDIFSATIKPVAATVFCTGGSAILNANTGTNYSYQWAFNGSPIPGATSSSLTATAAGDYTVTVTDNTNNKVATSDKVALTIIPGPSATVAASGALTFCPGSSLTLSTAVVPGITYQWQVNGSNISGATGATHQVTSAGQYTVMVSNVACASVSPIVTVAAGPLQLSIGNDTAFCETPNAALVLDAGHAGATYTWNTGANSQQIPATTSGKYWVEVNAGPGCVATDTIQVTVNPLPSVSGISFNRSGNTFQFSANGVKNAASYFWIFNDGVTSNSQTPSHTFTIQPTEVTLVLTNDCGADTIKLNLNATGVNDVNKDELALNLFPNPASDKITLQADGSFVLENIAVVNQLGQVVMTEELNGGVKAKTIDVSNLPVGYYILRAGTSGEMIAKPFNITR